MDTDPTVAHGPIWQGASVLVVDDEPSMRRVLRRTLEAERFHVEEAPDGESALKLVQARTQPFDLVLTDLSMPLIDGRQVSEALRRYRPSVAVLCMSADPDSVPYIESEDLPVRVMLKPLPRRICITRCATPSPVRPTSRLSRRQRSSRRTPG
jgi:CheY-like chemotaxis protein